MGRIVHFELAADNPEIITEFYKNVFGWSYQKWGESQYWLAETGEAKYPGINGAISIKGGFVKNIVNTINVDDIKKSLEDIKVHGGTVISEIMEVPNVGLVAYFNDPEGNTFSLIEDVA